MKKYIFSALLAGGMLLGQSALAFPTYSDEGNPPCDGFSDSDPCGTPPTAEEHQAWLDAGADQVIANGSIITEVDVIMWSITNAGGHIPSITNATGDGGVGISFPDFEQALQDALDQDIEVAFKLLMGRVVLDLLEIGEMSLVDARSFLNSIEALSVADAEMLARLDALESIINLAATQSQVQHLQQQIDALRILILTHRH